MLHMLFSISMRNDGNDDILTKTICRQCEKELDIPQECRMVPEEHDKHISPGSCDAHHAGNMRQDGK